ncbi:S-adenosyl-L-methionine-dependent methyltransferase [Chaetomium tenue]|uniref:S-adenosyl-L-methionine-dependent methyltransferase n=1 Tax=Chaetomium tenue TaxID=1854479 RepID=A0ACB7P2X6_9PEZI|nr:S-adenosyl-L-methionine-dependent methyltransferase [Chaetomium globosum]
MASQTGSNPPPSPTSSESEPETVLPADSLPAQQEAEEPLNDEQDSGYEHDNASSTVSLPPAVLDYRTLHGRRFHSTRHTNARYWTPNDELHCEAADLMHDCITLVHDGGLFKAPLQDGLERVLDVGTGTGQWAIDFADAHPNTQTFPANHFDYVHMRLLFGSVPDWPRLLREAYRCCKPGGSFDVVGEGLVQDAFGRAGFVDVNEWEFECPFGSWPDDQNLKNIGTYARAAITRDAQGWILFVWSEIMDQSLLKVVVDSAILRVQLRNPDVHANVLMRSVYGRKPGQKEVHTAAASGRSTAAASVGATSAAGGESAATRGSVPESKSVLQDN